jgi:hypothetical protein
LISDHRVGEIDDASALRGDCQPSDSNVSGSICQMREQVISLHGAKEHMQAEIFRLARIFLVNVLLKRSTTFIGDAVLKLATTLKLGRV